MRSRRTEARSSLHRLHALVVATALVLAQHAALAHQVWHAAGQHPGHDGQPLCEHHADLGTVMGAIAGSMALPLPESQRAVAVPAAVLAARENVPPTPSSRGPPALP